MTLKQKSKGVYFDNSFDPANFDSIIFDCDGVLVDITNSYDQTIIKTAKYVLETIAKINEYIGNSDVQTGSQALTGDSTPNITSYKN